MQAKRQQQTFTGTKQHRTKITGAIDDVTQASDTHGEERPNQRNDQPDQSHHYRRNNRHKTGATEERQRIRQANVVETFMQHPDNDPGDYRTEDPSVDRLDPQNVLHVVSFEDRRIRGGQYSLGR
ncbi:hypothetical protein D3C81_1720530 [compost metagenome]